MFEVGWDLWRSSGPKLLLKQGHLQPAAQDCVSEDEDSTASLGNLCWYSVIPTVENCFLKFRGSLWCFSQCPFPLNLSLSTTEESGSIFFAPSFRYLNMLIRLHTHTHTPLTYLQIKQFQVPYPFLRDEML